GTLRPRNWELGVQGGRVMGVLTAKAKRIVRRGEAVRQEKIQTKPPRLGFTSSFRPYSIRLRASVIKSLTFWAFFVNRARSCFKAGTASLASGPITPRATIARSWT